MKQALAKTITIPVALMGALAITFSVRGQEDQKATNLFELHEAEYVQPEDPTIIEMGTAHYIAIEGQGAPEGEVFQQSVGALYTLAFTMKMQQQTQAKKYYSNQSA